MEETDSYGDNSNTECRLPTLNTETVPIFYPVMNYIAIAVIFGLVMLADTIIGTPYAPNEEEQLEEYREKLQQILPFAHKRACIARGRSCDVRPNSCCGSSSCRCNLWGTNCRCQRQGLFQSWGK
ncbi:uncharacterized protein LOC111086773 [Limulus polyphemus]|uniref:Uncharacterized protein LOC111086773 n=1 Tax=Limulus polyphemus TaxID=6850 RepID=A0ABM1SSU4_LIMPO|nr:uncharacterized protein LOC111086773 [Limulus polyphemus]